MTRAEPPQTPPTAGEALVRALYEEHGRALLTYATRLTRDRAAAEDVVQETLIRAWRHPDVLVNGRGSVRGWLLTVARNIVTDKIRARAARPAEVAESVHQPAAVEVDHADYVVDSMLVMGAMEVLSVDHRSVLEEIYFAGHSIAEAAEVLSIPPGTVKSRCYYALRALRSTLEPEPVATGEGGQR